MVIEGAIATELAVLKDVIIVPKKVANAKAVKQVIGIQDVIKHAAQRIVLANFVTYRQVIAVISQTVTGEVTVKSCVTYIIVKIDFVIKLRDCVIHVLKTFGETPVTNHAKYTTA